MTTTPTTTNIFALQSPINTPNPLITLYTKNDPYCVPENNSSSAFTGNNYPTGSCNSNQLEIKQQYITPTLQKSWCLDNNNVKQAISGDTNTAGCPPSGCLNACPKIGGIEGRFTFPNGIQSYNIENRFCEGDSYFNLPCLYNTQEIINGWNENDITTFNNKVQPVPINWQKQSDTNPKPSDGDNSVLENLYNYASLNFCATPVIGDCDETQFENNNCPNLKSKTNSQVCSNFVNAYQQTHPTSNLNNTIMQYYCQNDNLLNNACVSFCSHNPDLCNESLQSYCNNNPDLPDVICGCYRPSTFYDNLSKDLQSKFPSQFKNILSVKKCNYAGCQSSNFIPKNATSNNCNDQCIQSTSFNVGGNINTDNIKINQSAKCMTLNQNMSNNENVDYQNNNSLLNNSLSNNNKDNNNNLIYIIIVIAIICLLILIGVSIYFYFK